jgi:hypothetical protein
MPLLTSAPISELGVELLRRSLVLVNTVSRIPTAEYAGPSGGTVTLRVPQPRAAREQVTPGAAITYDAADEAAVDVTLKHFYNAVLVSDEDLSLTLEDFGRQLLLPAVQAVADASEDTIAAVMNGLTADAGVKWAAAANPDADTQTILKAREKMTVAGVPAGLRYMAVAPNIATRLLSVPTFVQADRRGATTALEQAVIGMVYGITFVESAAIATGSAIAYHSSGFAFGNAAPVAPGGGADSTNALDGGVSLRHVLAFDPGRLATASVVSAFAGAAVVPENTAGTTIKRAIKIATSAV